MIDRTLCFEMYEFCENRTIFSDPDQKRLPFKALWFAEGFVSGDHKIIWG